MINFPRQISKRSPLEIRDINLPVGVFHNEQENFHSRGLVSNAWLNMNGIQIWVECCKPNYYFGLSYSLATSGMAECLSMEEAAPFSRMEGSWGQAEVIRYKKI